MMLRWLSEPVGVIAGLIPVTNPVATLVFKAPICIKARDALIRGHTVVIHTRSQRLLGAANRLPSLAAR